MATNKYSDDSDDFFDTAEPTTGDSSKPGKSRKRVSVSSERERSSDSDSDSPDRQPANQRSRSRSSSLRSRDSSFSDNSRSRSPSRTRKRHSDSRSRSSSTNSSRSKSYSSDSHTPEKETTNRKAKVNNRRGSNLSVDIACTTENEKQHQYAKFRSRGAGRNQAWNSEIKSKKSEQVRKNGSNWTSSDDRKIRQGHRNKKYSLVDSDSDITDVSPISSPRNQLKEVKKQHETKPPKPVSRGAGVRADSRRIKDDRDKNALELNLLVKAVSELEKQTRVQSNTRRVMFEPSRTRREQKSNYTFSDSDTHRIEQENQRLLRQIMCQMHANDGRYTGSVGKGKKSVVPASGINRLRDHHRIEKENVTLLRRLQHIKPSRGISRQEQLSAYNSTLLHGVPISTMHTFAPVGGRPKSSQSRAGSEAGSLGRTRSLTSVQSAATASSFQSAQSGRLRSRPSSAKTSIRERPPWDDRW